jgi:hypothetical protein
MMRKIKNIKLFLKVFLKRFFCKHYMEFDYPFGRDAHIFLRERFLICKKCGQSFMLR